MNQTASLPCAGVKVPEWHFRMMRDNVRNASIEAAIASCNVVEKTIVEIGTGAGLPAMLFAKYGASRVFTCEMNERVAAAAREIIRTNGFQGRIAVIAKSSRQAILDGDLPSAPDIIFTETLDAGVVGEGYEVISEDIRKIAGPATVVMPGLVRQVGFLCTDLRAFEQNSVFYECGLDLSGFNLFSKRSYFSVGKDLHDPTPLSPLILVRSYDYLNTSSLDPVEHQVVAHSSGICHGMMSYFEAHFGQFLVSSRERGSHWSMAFHPLLEPMPVESGRHYFLKADKSGSIGLISI
ncbi:MAG: ribonucleotide-diphosphate reductase subunit beta [Mesorhizobium sp.]|uniref:ribonucleotide-diphosphate reductase subunit beta n=1 Tax=Mesorhizobium sp. TaxID=1871066 RepID=UPI000FEA3F2E|nr:ribonucleotide-diphosphate reductase subunit beta [Mesorhizobium sp.]RWH21132.1 MAG: ribonucleotide-diphosphate reductase subunit beta [Mesorhizobium sp.]RWH38668.1 MAG: ribonucleotide-diphosphate reductase subunit beta [Mesorhizobium sp.]TIM70878.1 MAG: ribonucleotide-diphosphate reductase subunit beta [Mesorhizobium sp.]TIO05251.1 MAG: ribonucleotide-diphosphate reductase subunit beta [Mesorhizobium sp.]TIR61907.1 MAG: ribonucleotide-diphosphate reductase subunit beta [Mesorhizobium sp.]